MSFWQIDFGYTGITEGRATFATGLNDRLARYHMALSKPVLLRNCQHLSEARYAAGMEVSYIGFLFSGADDDMRRHQVAAIWNWLAGVELVAEIHEPNPELIESVRQEFNPAMWLVTAETASLLTTKDSFVLIGPANTSSTAHAKGRLLNLQQADAAADMPLWLEITDSAQLELASEKAEVIVISGKPEERPGYPDLDFAASVLESLEIEN